MQKHERGQVITDAARVYEGLFVPALFGQWPERVLDLAAVKPGHSVLDVGCGTGVLARAARRRIGPTGRVAGVDPNEGMLVVARESSAAVDWQAGFAEELPFETGSFDRVLSQFAAMFFEDRARAFEEMARVLSASGTAVVVTWASLEETPGYAALAELLDDLFGGEASAALRAPFSLGQIEDLHRLISVAFANFTVERHEGTAEFASIEDWVHTEIRGWTLAESFGDDEFEELLRLAHRRLGRFAESGRVSFPAPALIAVARR
jgi:ubiquinone/menaquinone biosynthesis C-methylase UbiE